ncbi:hypothetical protein FHR81_002541 [Actinoalloteichus hoggarensis]|uniref:hypothetical protein n=1 Tax=Actinoalloteichus hoggarensis TaxID=1470176 RepID=UPI0012FE2A2F|nr:hypothetical protein [Actinoalloteichus hoggarensis]MBB5921501.1 hypothetical protein [Actinoalloteichus hoggarensis]
MSGDTTRDRGLGITVLVALAAALAVAGIHLIGTYLPTIMSSTALRTATGTVHDRYVSVPDEILETDVPRYHWTGGELYLASDEDGAQRRSLNCLLRPVDGSESAWVVLEHRPEHAGTLVYRGTPAVATPADLSCVNDAREQVLIYTGADMDRAAAVADRWWTVVVGLQAVGAAILVLVAGIVIGRVRGRTGRGPRAG